MGSSQSIQAIKDLSNKGIDAVEVGFHAASTVPGDVPGATGPDDACTRQMQAVMAALKEQHRTSLGLQQGRSPEELVASGVVKKGAVWLVIADLRCYCPPIEVDAAGDTGWSSLLSNSVLGVPITWSTRSLFKSRVRKVAATVARLLSPDVKGLPTVAAIVDDVDCWGEISAQLGRALDKARPAAPPSMQLTDRLSDFVEALHNLRSESGTPPGDNHVVCTPPMTLAKRLFPTSVGAELPLIAQLAPIIDATVMDALSAAFGHSPMLRALPAAIGPTADGELTKSVLTAMRHVVVPPPQLGAKRVLLCGWVKSDDSTMPFCEAVGFNVNRMDHLCTSFDVIGLIGHPPITEMSDSLATVALAAERRGTTLWRAPDCAVVNSAGKQENVVVAQGDAWPLKNTVLGIGMQTIIDLQTFLSRAVKEHGAVHVTIVGTWSLIGPAVGLRDVMMSCNSSGSVITLVTESDNMAVRVESKPPAAVAAATPHDDASDAVLKKLPFGFAGEVRQSLMQGADGLRWLCGESTSQK